MNETAQQLLEQFQPEEVKAITADPQVLVARFTPCGKQLVAGGFDSRVRRWDVTSDETPELPALEGHGGWVQALAYHGDSATLFSGDSWGKLCAWPYAQESPQPRWNVDAAHDGWIRDLAVSPDGDQLASCGGDGKLRLWSVSDGTSQGELAGYGEDLFCVRFHPAGEFILTADQKGRVKQWDLQDGRCVRDFDAGVLYQYHRIQDVGGVRALTLDAEGKRLICGGTQPKNGGNVTGVPALLVFDWESGRLLHKLEPGKTNDVYVCDAHWHDKGFVMAVTSGTPGSGKLLYQRLEDEEPFFVTTKMANCHSLSVHPDGLRLAVTATSKGSNGNGRRLTKDGQYAGNTSPIHILRMPAPATG